MKAIQMSDSEEENTLLTQIVICLVTMAVTILVAIASKKYLSKNGPQFHRVENSQTQSEIEIQDSEASMRV